MKNIFLVCEDDRLLFGKKKKEIFPLSGFMQVICLIMRRLDEIFNFRMANCAIRMLLGSGVKKNSITKNI